MIIEMPKVTLEGLYNQKQAAEALHIDRHTIARYAAKGAIKFLARKAGGKKVTTGEEIIRCWKDMHQIK